MGSLISKRMNEHFFDYVLQTPKSSQSIAELTADMKRMGFKPVGKAFRRGDDSQWLQAFVTYSRSASAAYAELNPAPLLLPV